MKGACDADRVRIAPRFARVPREGVTLLELLVALVILGLLAGIAGLSWRRGAWSAPDRDENNGGRAVASARRQAIESGRSVTFAVESNGGDTFVTALPDGRVLGAATLGFDPLSGHRSDAEPSGGRKESAGH